MADFEKANKRPKISNKNVLLKQINDGQDGDSTEKQSNTQTEEQNKLRIVSKAAVTHVEKFQNNTAQKQIQNLLHKQDKKRNVALLDLSSDLIQLNKQILQKRLLDLPIQKAIQNAYK